MDHSAFKVLFFLFLVSLVLGLITFNGAGLVGAFEVVLIKGYGVEWLKQRPGSVRNRAMGIFFHCFLLLGVLSLVFFAVSKPWYGDPTAWFFTILFFTFCVWTKNYFDDQKGIRLDRLAYLIGGVLLSVGFFAQSWAWFITGLNWFWLYHVVQRIELKKTNSDSRLHFALQIAAVPAMLWVISNLLGTWDLRQPVDGDHTLWVEEVICLLLGGVIGNYVFEDKNSAEEEKAGNNNTISSLEGSHE